jgi:hypothetical protein
VPVTRRAAALALVCAAGAAGPARADGGDDGADGDADAGAATEVVQRSLLLPRKAFGVDASVRGSNGVDGQMFEYVTFGLVAGTGSGKTDIKFGMDLLASQPGATEFHRLQKASVSLASAVGTGGALGMDLRTYLPADDDAVKPQIGELGVMFKRAPWARGAILAGGAVDFTYLLFPEGAEPDDAVWVTRFLVRAGAQAQLSPAVALEALGELFVPIAENPEDGAVALDAKTGVNGRFRGYWTLGAGFDVYVELGLHSRRDLAHRLTIRDRASALLGFQGRL